MTAKIGEVVRLAQPILSAPVPRPGSIGLLASLNWPARICDLIGDVLDYGKEVKRLEVEAKRIDQKAAIRHHQIDTTAQLKMEELRQQSRRVRDLLADASANLKRTRIDRRKTARAITHLSKIVGLPSTSTEVRKAVQEVLAKLIELQTAQMQDSRAVFDRAVSATQAEINSPSNQQRSLTPLED